MERESVESEDKQLFLPIWHTLSRLLADSMSLTSPLSMGLGPREGRRHNRSSVALWAGTKR